MIQRRHIAVAVTFTCALAALRGSVAASDAPKDLYISPDGMLRMEGIADLKAAAGVPGTRYTSIVVSSFPDESSGPPSPWAHIQPVHETAYTPEGVLKYAVSTLLLLEGCAYVQMKTSPPGMALSEAEQFAAVLDAPEEYSFLLAENLQERRSRVAALQALRAAYPGPEGLADLIEQLTAMRAGDRTGLVRGLGDDATEAGLELLGRVRSTSDIGDSISFVRFPFILARRTIGGAEGTEIVTSAHAYQVGTEDRTDVMYFYLHSEKIDPIKVRYHVQNLVDDKQAIDPEYLQIPLASFARITLKPVMHEGEEHWVRVGADAPVPMPISEHLDLEIRADVTVRDLLSLAYTNACGAGIRPQSPLRLGELELDCPQQ